MDEVYNSLFVSGTIKDYNELKKNGIKAVINTKSEEHDTISLLTEMNIAYYYLPIADWGCPRSDQIKTLMKIWVSYDEPILLHCAQGRGRSACLAVAIMVHEGMDIDDAIKQIRERRPIVTMLDSQIGKIRKEMCK